LLTFNQTQLPGQLSGTIRVQSEPGKSSVFSLSLPVLET
jgi:chemotaxis protein histidine kinase CheA